MNRLNMVSKYGKTKTRNSFMCRERESIRESERGLHAGAKDVIPVGVQGPKWVNVWVLMEMNVLLCG